MVVIWPHSSFGALSNHKHWSGPVVLSLHVRSSTVPQYFNTVLFWLNLSFVAKSQHVIFDFLPEVIFISAWLLILCILLFWAMELITTFPLIITVKYFSAANTVKLPSSPTLIAWLQVPTIWLHSRSYHIHLHFMIHTAFTLKLYHNNSVHSNSEANIIMQANTGIIKVENVWGFFALTFLWKMCTIPVNVWKEIFLLFIASPLLFSANCNTDLKFHFSISRIFLGTFKGSHSSHGAAPLPICLPTVTQAGCELRQNALVRFTLTIYALCYLHYYSVKIHVSSLCLSVPRLNHNNFIMWYFLI